MNKLVVLNQQAPPLALPTLPRIPGALADVEPESVTLLPTYRCNAACRECCFESHPGIKHRMSREYLLLLIRRIHPTPFHRPSTSKARFRKERYNAENSKR